MFHSSRDKNWKKKSSSTKRIKQAGDNLTLSQFSNPNAAEYLQDVKTGIPEKLKYKKQEIKDNLTKMKSVKPSENIGAEKHAPVKIGEIKLDTGILEVGYDDEKEDMVFSFVYYNATAKDGMVYENKPTKTLGYNGEWFRSQSQEFVGNSVDFRTGIENYYRIGNNFSKLSTSRDHNTTLDQVIPFIQDKDEQKKIDDLRNMKSNNNKDRSNIHDAISGVEELKTKKDQRKIDFVQKFTKAVKDANEIKHKFANKDDYILYLKKKWLMMYEQGYIDKPNDNNKGDENHEVGKEYEYEDKSQNQEQESEVIDSKESEVSDDTKDQESSV